MDSANQTASAEAAAVTAADQKASFGDQLARAASEAVDQRAQLAQAASDAFHQRAQFDDEMAEARLVAGDMQDAFDKLICDNTDQKASVTYPHSL